MYRTCKSLTVGAAHVKTISDGLKVVLISPTASVHELSTHSSGIVVPVARESCVTVAHLLWEVTGVHTEPQRAGCEPTRATDTGGRGREGEGGERGGEGGREGDR